jgi:hypothetical protein
MIERHWAINSRRDLVKLSACLATACHKKMNIVNGSFVATYRTSCRSTLRHEKTDNEVAMNDRSSAIPDAGVFTERRLDKSN